MGTFRTKIIALVLIVGGGAYSATPLDPGRIPAVFLHAGTPPPPWYSDPGRDMVHFGLLLLVASFVYDWWRRARSQ